MITTKQGALAGLVLLLACGWTLLAKPGLLDLIAPALVNLDLPVDEPLTADEVQDFDNAREGIWRPQRLHDLIVKLIKERVGLEALKSLVILFPDVFERNHPKNAAALRAEAAAAQAILNPDRGVLVQGPQN